MKYLKLRCKWTSIFLGFELLNNGWISGYLFRITPFIHFPLKGILCNDHFWILTSKNKYLEFTYMKQTSSNAITWRKKKQKMG